VDILVATPGRLEDLMRAGEVDLRRVEVVVLDESDRMLDQGFFTAVRRILSTVPRERQTLLFSATMPEEIRALARSVQRDAVEVKVTPVATPAAQVEQEVLFVARTDKRELLAHLLADPAVTRALVFTRTKRGADRVAKHLCAVERVEAIHGDRSQSQRERALASFKRGSTRVLVATDPQRGASTWTESPTSSTSSFPTTRRATYTASVVPAVRPHRAWLSRSATPMSAISSGASSA
jgi:ATP-dependent RNA helicase RhlE